MRMHAHQLGRYQSSGEIQSPMQSPEVGNTIINQYIKILLVCLCVTDVGVAVTNLRVVCKIITCHRNGYNLSRDSIKKLLLVGTLGVAGYAKDAIVDACHRTSDRQEHKIIWWAGPEQDTIFYLRVTSCREQGSHCHDERLAWVASGGQWTSFTYYNSFVSKVLGANYNRANNFHPVADKFAMH